MPLYVKIDSKNFGTITQQTGSDKLAGRNSNVTTPLSEDFSLAYDWGLMFHQPHNTGFGAADHSQAALESEVSFKLPMYHSVPALLLNVMANKDTLSKVEVYEVDRGAAGGQNKVSMHAIFSNGIVTDLKLEQGDQRDPQEKGRGFVAVKMKFQEVSYDDKVVNVSGHLDTTNAS